ncbi:hypothetical protein AA15669_1820 [Saccharibacter floricola DSM 15669]|uniref:Uncharacterized protein n=1 Tax=Saccharibacter floricola DSM 15669 TaxID=1123227 RepID=A0ABQ0P1D4_9PROT|nr:hypothetical protein AA15669_1820 [Saccharibacter floricola DSM 15669]
MPLAITPLCSYLRRGRNKQLQIGIGKDNRPNVTTINYGTMNPSNRTLSFKQRLPHCWLACYERGCTVNLRNTEIITFQISGLNRLRMLLALQNRVFPMI